MSLSPSVRVSRLDWCDQSEWWLVLQTFKILAAERLRLIKFCTRLIADYFQYVVNVLRCWFSTKWWNSETRNMKQFPKVSGIECISKSTCYSKSTSRGCPSETVACWRIPLTGTAYSDNPSVLSDKEFRIIAIIWTSRVKPINRDYFSVPSEYD